MLMPKKEGLKKAEAILQSVSQRPKKTAAEAKAEHEQSKAKSMADVKARNEAQRLEAIKRDKADLPNLEKRHAELSAIRSKGKNWEYADREQNLSDEEREARNASSELQHLSGRIHAAKNASFKHGGKISLKNCKVSTHEKNSKHKDW